MYLFDQETFLHDWKIADWDVKHNIKQKVCLVMIFFVNDQSNQIHSYI